MKPRTETGLNARGKMSLVCAVLLVAIPMMTAEAQFRGRKITPASQKVGPPPSGILDFREENFGINLTECPQARLAKVFPDPPDRRRKDLVEQYSEGGDDRRTNEEYSCFPQNETSIAVNPLLTKNLVAGANDYRFGLGSSGVYASVDNGQKWYNATIPFPTIPIDQGYLPSSGDPAVAFDRAGVVYYAQIAFDSDDDNNGIFVSRSTNGGYTWTRARVSFPNAAGNFPAPNPVIPGDGVVVFQPDNNGAPDFSATFHDKEYIATGPRPAGVPPQCFNPAHVPMLCNPDFVGVDRIYVTWTAFNNPVGTPGSIVSSTIEMSYSDDQGRSWSPRKTINGSASFCAFAFAGGNQCDDNQFSVPTVSPTTGHLYVAFENFNTPEENQYLVVRSVDGGNTFAGPFFVTPVFDINFPRAGLTRPDCSTRGAQFGRIVYTNSCFRSNSAGNIVADKRGGAFADDLYLVMSDNRNGTVGSSNADVFLFKSNNGGTTWIGPTRVNDDRSDLGTFSRDCGRTDEDFFGNPTSAAECISDFGADQWWPWVDINEKGHLNVVFNDRRLDTASTASEWPTSRQRPGNYLVWFWGAQCTIKTADSATECLAPGAAPIPQPTEPFNPGSGPVPGQGTAFLGPFRNFGISDVPSNYDYSFQNGLFAGDYNNVAVAPGETKAYGFWTDARNGRSSSGSTGPVPQQTGRNPRCEQSDVMVNEFSSEGSTPGQDVAKKEDAMFLVTACPADGVGP